MQGLGIMGLGFGLGLRVQGSGRGAFEGLGLKVFRFKV